MHLSKVLGRVCEIAEDKPVEPEVKAPEVVTEPAVTEPEVKEEEHSGVSKVVDKINEIAASPARSQKDKPKPRKR